MVQQRAGGTLSPGRGCAGGSSLIDFWTCKAWGNQFWPAKYLVDARGRVRYTHLGEGAYGETERAIRALLAEAGGDRLGPVYPVLRSRRRTPRPVRVLLDGRPVAAAEAGADVRRGAVTVTGERLYRLVSLPSAQERRLTLRFSPA